MKTNHIKLSLAAIFLAILGILVVACKDEVLVPVVDNKKADSIIAVITKLDQQDVTINTKENTITIKNAVLNVKLDSLNNSFYDNPRKIQYTVYLINAGNSITTTNDERTKGVDGATVTVLAGGKTQTVTSTDGRAVFEGLGGGNATVQISATGFTPVTFQTFFFSDNRSSFGDGAVRTASTNILIFPTSGKDVVTITGLIYANKSTIDDTLGRQYKNIADPKHLTFISNPGISDFTNYTHATDHSWSSYLYYHPNSQYDSIPDGTTVKYDKITSLKGANIFAIPDRIRSTQFIDFDPTVPGEVLNITYTGLASVATVDNTGKYTLTVASYANFPGVTMYVERYTDSHNFLTSKNNVGSTPITLTSFDVNTYNPYVTTKKIFYQITSNWIYRASITGDDGGFIGVPFSNDYYEFFLGYTGSTSYNTTSAGFEGKPGTTVNRNIFFYATVPAP
jgi:hypothetical protein